MTSDAEWDEDGTIIPGTHAISTVHLVLWENGKPIPTATSAICDVCGDWASTLSVSGATTGTAVDLTDVRESRRLTVVVYACSKHEKQVADALCDEYGQSVNLYEADDLALKVTQYVFGH